mmetsp:Transcript_20270/g.28287  ORF Transcript_20270/g.28287 Transcript_20270/m.28287 type:complete len:143 (-) Transcript_20270:81-509(-)
MCEIIRGKRRALVENCLVEVVISRSLEWLRPAHHTVKHDTKREDVHGIRVSMIGDHLGSNVPRSPRVTFDRLVSNNGETQVGESAIAMEIKEYILELEVSINDVMRVNMLQAEQNLRCVKSGAVFRESVFIDKVELQISAEH